MSGHGFIEVKPFGMSKGAFAQLLIRYYSQFGEPLDFLLALGYGLTNEDLFSSIKIFQKQNNEFLNNNCRVYLTTVGQSISTANYFVRDQKIVEDLVFELSKQCSNFACIEEDYEDKYAC